MANIEIPQGVSSCVNATHGIDINVDGIAVAADVSFDPGWPITLATPLGEGWVARVSGRVLCQSEDHCRFTFEFATAVQRVQIEEPGHPAPRHLLEVIGQSLSIAEDKMRQLWKKNADLVVELDINGVSFDCFDRAKELIANGVKAGRATLPQLRRPLRLPAPDVVLGIANICNCYIVS